MDLNENGCYVLKISRDLVTIRIMLYEILKPALYDFIIVKFSYSILWGMKPDVELTQGFAI